MKRLLFLLAVSALFSGCKKEVKQIPFAEDASGFSIKQCIIGKNDPVTNVGDVIIGELQIRLNDSAVLHSNYGNPERLFKINEPQSGTIDKYLLNLHIGDSVIIKTPAHYLENNLVGMKFKQNDKLFFYLKISQIITYKELNAKQKQDSIKESEEENALTEFVNRKYPKAKRLPSGVYVDIVKSAQGSPVASGSKVRVNYSVSDTEGKIYDATIKSVAQKAKIYDAKRLYQPYEFIVGSGESIAGFSEGVSAMLVGEKAVIIVPSRLGYGSQQRGPIKPFTTLIFTTELLSAE
ncbi:MAG: FKBP-type peptidyl-prolyl cis-trans isomerase [Bacteroidales bacterium]|jgi:FKBP-type peptidyl-prolyl cis-trans isomerase|nr:FKBP-type peptidyl-prolyl cis-trans isomerase [Bacteroidales bacterium]